LLGFDLLVLHANFDASETFQGADIAKEPRP
jgi:hypothetical protein